VDGLGVLEALQATATSIPARRIAAKRSGFTFTTLVPSLMPIRLLADPIPVSQADRC